MKKATENYVEEVHGKIIEFVQTTGKAPRFVNLPHCCKELFHTTILQICSYPILIPMDKNENDKIYGLKIYYVTNSDDVHVF